MKSAGNLKHYLNFELNTTRKFLLLDICQDGKIVTNKIDKLFGLIPICNVINSIFFKRKN
jgi:hypothetical protein